MRINVGTKNPTKIDAVKETIADYDFLAGAEVVALEVESGIAEQPMTLKETIQGAINRAKNSFKNCDYSIGLESGMFKVPHTKTGYMDLGVCAIYDSKQIHLGFSSAFEYPPKVMELVHKKGMNISEATLSLGLTKQEYVGHAEGTIGIVSKGKINRKEYTKQSIVTALIHLQNPDLY
jgi:inosine/xanthosine triphosphatase